MAKLKAAMPPDVAKALARVSGGLYVVTAAHGDARSAMIASWVAQASFEPLGLTVAVAKDRAIESFMQASLLKKRRTHGVWRGARPGGRAALLAWPCWPLRHPFPAHAHAHAQAHAHAHAHPRHTTLQVGDRFVLNCLPEGGYAATMKHFLQRFPPGADRFAGVAWEPAPCGAPILAAACAHVECRVVSRMESADHYVTYAAVTGGGVRDGDVRTAVHRRKARRS